MNYGIRAEILPHGPLQYAPENEMGVVFLFSYLASRLAVRVEKISTAFPDCIAYQKVGGRERRIRIEFEYRSSNFRAHHHSLRKCDWIVCWEHDWPRVPQRIRVIELRKYFGLGFNVWVQPVIPSQWHDLEQNRVRWALSKRAHSGDVLLMYRCHPDKRIEDIFTLAGCLSYGKASWRRGKCYYGDIHRICTLDSPVFLKDLRSDPIIKTASFVRRNMQGNLLVTEYWPYLYRIIAGRNPKCRKIIRRFAPRELSMRR